MGNKALLVGINTYKLPGCDLSGCVNDVTNVRDILLKHFGFAVEDIRVLVDARATRKGILERLQWLVEGAKAGDCLLFHLEGLMERSRDPVFLQPLRGFRQAGYQNARHLFFANQCI